MGSPELGYCQGWREEKLVGEQVLLLAADGVPSMEAVAVQATWHPSVELSVCKEVSCIYNG